MKTQQQSITHEPTWLLHVTDSQVNFLWNLLGDVTSAHQNMTHEELDVLYPGWLNLIGQIEFLQSNNKIKTEQIILGSV